MMKETAPAMVKTITVKTLGGFSIQVDGNLLTDSINRSKKLWNVLCYLIVHRDRNIPQAEFIKLFWPGDRSVNPVNALKTLLYRVRALLAPMFPADLDPILSQRGSYSWNRSIVCQVDADRFEALCLNVQESGLSDGQRIELYQEIVSLYQGNYLPKLSKQAWVASRSDYYHGLYIQAVKAYAALLENAQAFRVMSEVCTRAIQLSPLDESLHVLLVRAFLRQGKNADALEQYIKATDLLYRNVGVQSADELRALYTEIMAVEQHLETNLEIIQSSLQESRIRVGAFVCEFGYFQEAYRLEARRLSRDGVRVQLALLTVSLPEGGLPPLGTLNTTMDQLLDVLVQNLRLGDVISRYSGAQYIILLPAATLENGAMVMERILTAFYHQHRRNFLKLTYRIRGVEAI